MQIFDILFGTWDKMILLFIYIHKWFKQTFQEWFSIWISSLKSLKWTCMGRNKFSCYKSFIGFRKHKKCTEVRCRFVFKDKWNREKCGKNFIVLLYNVFSFLIRNCFNIHYFNVPFNYLKLNFNWRLNYTKLYELFNFMVKKSFYQTRYILFYRRLLIWIRMI